jgi:hypothetical protein
MKKKLFISLLVCIFLLPRASHALENNRILLIDDFDSETTTNLLGGETGGDEETLGGCVPLFTQSSSSALGRYGHSLILDFDVTMPGTFSFYTTKLGVAGDLPFTFTSRDLSQYRYLSFWYKTDLGNPNFALEVHRDSDGDGQFIFGKDSSSKVIMRHYLRNNEPGIWHKIVIPLSAFSQISQWDNIIEFVFVFDNGIGSAKGKIYFDELLIGTNPMSDDDRERINFPGAMRANLLLVNGKRLSEATFQDEGNTVDILIQNIHPYLERISFEVRAAYDEKWMRVCTFFDHLTGMYAASWSMPEGMERGGYIRVVAADVLGAEAVISGPTVFVHK